MTRACNCVGHLTNPGGVCCLDLHDRQAPKWVVGPAPPPLTEEQIRNIIREEIERAKP